MRLLLSAMRILVVSYAFPPVGGAGVQRVLKLIKYLPEHGITPTVLTVDNASVPVRDASLLRDVPPSVEIIRVRTFEPNHAAKEAARRLARTADGNWAARAKSRLVGLGMKLLTPDPQVLWLPAAHRALVRRLLRRADDLVFISGPPFSQFWLAPIVRLQGGTAVVLDYRDEWRMASPTKTLGLGARTESLALRCADAVTTATAAYGSELCARFPFLDPARVHTIPNGYDADDFRQDIPGPSGGRFVLAYVGTVFPLTTARWLIAAVRLLHERSPELARHFTLRFVGRVVESESRFFQDTEAVNIERTGYVDHDRAIEELSRSHAAVCILDALPGAERVYPAKIFEIMRLRKPCLILAPPGALTDLVRQHAVGEVVSSRDVNAIASALERMLRAFSAGVAPLKSTPLDAERFDRRRQAGQFSDVFRAAVAVARDRSVAASRRSAEPTPLPSVCP